ncbi:hypothetical protein [Actinobacillus porcinus]|uniref:hypothetical protein n=1 Tax=Actinobacillus TaxID=713 RepID=UPI0023F1A265|nr:hypothetical protein [Actinobacillus porcinus]MDD7544500.1 hypothetical protein [Actinobacillus porcinus]MDY5847155.1 hypothetical protein [Actinobacillus porcinus]
MGNEWIKPILGKGFAVLLTLRLKNAPTEDMVKPTLETWFQVLTYKKQWEQELDQERFEQAFMWISQNCDWFPTPKVFLDAMPKRKIKELPPPPPKTAEQEEAERLSAVRNLQKIKAMLGRCYAK